MGKQWSGEKAQENKGMDATNTADECCEKQHSKAENGRLHQREGRVKQMSSKEGKKERREISQSLAKRKKRRKKEKEKNLSS